MWSKEFAKVGVIGALTLYVCKRVATIAEAGRKFFGGVDARRELDYIAKGSNMVFTNPPRAYPVGARDALSARC